MPYPSRLADLPEAPERPRPARQSAHGMLGGLVVAALFLFVIGRMTPRTQLIAPINPDIQTAAIFVGAFAGALVVGALLMRTLGVAPLAERGGTSPSLGKLPEAIAFAGCCVLAATWCARGIVEVYAFAGLSPASFPAEFTVVGRAEGRHGRREVRLRFGPAGREFALPVTDAAFDAAQPGEAVTLSVQTGRSGIQRAVAPRRWLRPADLHGG